MAPVHKLSAMGSLITNKIDYPSMLAGNTAYTPAAYDSIATVAVGSGGASTVTFSSIPATYQHLQIRIFTISAATYSDMNFNADFNNNYSYHQLNGDGTAVYSAGSGAMNVIYANQLGGSTTYPSVGVMDILDYANTNKNKVVRLLSGLDSNGGGFIYYRTGTWFNTSAISTIRIGAQSGTGTFAQYTNIALYGIKGV